MLLAIYASPAQTSPGHPRLFNGFGFGHTPGPSSLCCRLPCQPKLTVCVQVCVGVCVKNLPLQGQNPLQAIRMDVECMQL